MQRTDSQKSIDASNKPSLLTRMMAALQRKFENTSTVTLKTNDGRKVPAHSYRKKSPQSTKNSDKVFFPKAMYT